jgi:hypothetical protein
MCMGRVHDFKVWSKVVLWNVMNAKFDRTNHKHPQSLGRKALLKGKDQYS